MGYEATYTDQTITGDNGYIKLQTINDNSGNIQQTYSVYNNSDELITDHTFNYSQDNTENNVISVEGLMSDSDYGAMNIVVNQGGVAVDDENGTGIFNRANTLPSDTSNAPTLKSGRYKYLSATHNPDGNPTTIGEGLWNGNNASYDALRLRHASSDSEKNMPTNKWPLKFSWFNVHSGNANSEPRRASIGCQTLHPFDYGAWMDFFPRGTRGDYDINRM